MANGISDIGNGIGLLYAVDSASNIVAVVPNTAPGIWDMKNAADLSIPFSGQRSAFGILNITAVVGFGAITNIDINGVNQIPGVISVGAITADTVAQLIEASINSYQPIGYDFKAVAVGSSVYIYGPESAGAAINGYTITLTDTGSVVNWTQEPFKNGAYSYGAVDPIYGFSIYINADYGPNGLSGELPADPTSLLYAVNISKYIVNRGLNNSVPSSVVTISGNVLANINRSSVITFIALNPSSGPTDTLIKINPDDFTDGDLLFISCYDAGNVITVESLNNITIPGGTGNIALTDDVPWVSDKYNTLMLSFRNDYLLGPVFSEISRSFAVPNNLEVNVGNTLFVSKTGDDTTAKRESFLYQYLTIAAAKTAAQAGDTIIIYPGTYAEGNLQKDGVNYYMYNGVIINCPAGIPFLNITTETMIVDGFAEINTNTANILTMNNGGTGDITLNCKNATATIGSLQLNSGKTRIQFYDTYSSNYRNIYFAFNGDHYVKAKRLIQTYLSPAYSPFSTYILRCGTSIASPFVGRAHVVCDEMIIDTENGSGGQSLMYIEAITSDGYLRVDAKQMFNRFTTFTTSSIYIARAVHNVEINGNIYCDGPGSKANAIQSATPGGVFDPQYVKFNGNIFVEEGWALYLSSVGNYEINGDIYKNASATPVSPFPQDAAIYIAGAVNAASAGKANVKIRGNIYIFATGSNAINKNIQPTTNPTYAPNTELDMICDIRNSFVYVDDPTMYVCDTTSTVTDPLIDNTLITTGVVTNLATPLPAGITEVGGAITTDVRVGKDNPFVGVPYPFINYQ